MDQRKCRCPTIPACPIPDGETAYRAGIMRGVRDACDSPEGSATKLEDIESILDRALSQKPQGSRD
jgi:hypothetical protein